MQKLLFLDNDFLSRAWTIGGQAYLDQLAMLAQQKGYALVVTDAVVAELGRKGNGPSIQSWLDQKAIPTIQTNEFGPYSQFLESKEAGTLPRDAKYRSANLGLDGGDASILERMRAEAKAGNVVAVASDDGFFRGVPNKGGQSIRGFGFDPSSTTLTTPDLVNQLKVRGNLTPEQLANIRKLPIFDPTHASYSKALSSKVLSDVEAMRVMKDGSTTTTSLLSKFGSGLKFLGLAGLIYDIGTSSAEAAEAAGRGDAGRAGEVMTQLAARTYGGLQLGLAGGTLAGIVLAGSPVAIAGILIGGIAGGVLGGVAGDLLVERIWGAARKAIKLLNYADSDGKVGHFRNTEQDLVANKMPADIARSVALALNDGTLINADSDQARKDYLQGLKKSSADNANAAVDGEVAVRHIDRGYGSITTVADGDTDIVANQDGKVVEERKYGPFGLSSTKTIDEWDGNVETKYSTGVYSADGRLIKATNVTPNGRDEYYYDPSTGKRTQEKNYDSSGVLIPPEVVKARRNAEERARWDSIAADRIAAAAQREAERRKAEEAKIAADKLAQPSTQPGGQSAGTTSGGGGSGGGLGSVHLPLVAPGVSSPPAGEVITGEVIPMTRPVTVTPGGADTERQMRNVWEEIWPIIDFHHRNEPRSGGHPVVLDLDKSRTFDIRQYADLHLHGEAGATGDQGPRFDFDGDRIPDRTAWVGPTDGFLVIDKGVGLTSTPDGLIDQPQELAFSKWKTSQEWRTELQAQGMDPDQPVTDLLALRLLFDSDRNGVLDSNDEQWNSFRVWQDENQDGVANPGELRRLEEAGIASIGLIPNKQFTADYADGSAITGTSRAEMADGSQMLVGDLSLRFQPSAQSEPALDSIISVKANSTVPAPRADSTHLDRKLDNLVVAMATFSPATAPQLTLPHQNASTLNPVIAANLQ